LNFIWLESSKGSLSEKMPSFVRNHHKKKK